VRVLQDWLLTPARVAVHLPTATAVVADLHLGYAQARRRGGDAVPHSCLEAELAPLLPVLRQQRVSRLIIAGDLFEAGPSVAMADGLRRWADDQGVELLVVPGNHDRGLAQRPELLPLAPDGVTLGAWRIVHGDQEAPAGPMVQGHEHPWVRWGALLDAPCFLVSEQCLVLPAFSRDASGVNVLRQRPWGKQRCWVIAGDQVLDFGEVATLTSRLRRHTKKAGKES